MFHAVRSWWRGGRGKVTLRLFAFEFVVVVAGVLTAQGLANWAQQRNERAEGQRLLADAMDAASEYQGALNYWHRYGPCLRRHVERIGAIAASGGTMDVAAIGRPALPSPESSKLTADDWRKIRAVIPDARADALGSVLGGMTTYEENLIDTARQWPVLRLVDGSAAPPTAEDRSRVRLAATMIDNNIRWMIFQHLTGSTGNLELAGVRPSTEVPSSTALVTACGLLKDWR